VQAVLRPVVGADRVARVLATGLGRITAASLHPAQVNGYPALILRLDGQVDTVIALRIDDGLITGLYAVRNPEKLSHMQRETALHRCVQGPTERTTQPASPLHAAAGDGVARGRGAISSPRLSAVCDRSSALGASCKDAATGHDSRRQRLWLDPTLTDPKRRAAEPSREPGRASEVLHVLRRMDVADAQGLVRGGHCQVGSDHDLDVRDRAVQED
jgi:hypothetical protein